MNQGTRQLPTNSPNKRHLESVAHRVFVPPAGIFVTSPASLLSLQRLAGNRAVARLLAESAGLRTTKWAPARGAPVHGLSVQRSLKDWKECLKRNGIKESAHQDDQYADVSITLGELFAGLKEYVEQETARDPAKTYFFIAVREMKEKCEEILDSYDPTTSLGAAVTEIQEALETESAFLYKFEGNPYGTKKKSDTSSGPARKPFPLAPLGNSSFENDFCINFCAIAQSKIPLSGMARPESKEGRQEQRNRQVARMIFEVLSSFVDDKPSLAKEVSEPGFLNAVAVHVYSKGMVTFNDVLNDVAVMLAKYEMGGSSSQGPVTMTLEERIQLVQTTVGDPASRIVQVGKLLWGSFRWYVAPEKYAGPQKDEFILWLTDPTEKAPEPGTRSRLNCWEGAIFVLYKAGRVTKAELRKLYLEHTGKVGVGVAYKLLKGDEQKEFWEDDEWKGAPAAGDIISIWTGEESEPHHVVLALENGREAQTEVLSLWTGGTGGMLGKTTLGDLSAPAISKMTYSTPLAKLG